MLSNEQVEHYLTRIGLSARPAPTLASLHALQAAHMRAVPFENLDILLGRPLSLDIPDLYDKIVTRRRGGYCFELNTLYAALLTALGFTTVPLLARVWLRDPLDIPPRTHLVHRVAIEGTDWLTDVGFGGSASHVPLPVDPALLIPDPDGELRIRPDPVHGFRVARRLAGSDAWEEQYSFEIVPAAASDILLGNHFTETHPSSHFRAGIGIGLFGSSGRTGLYGGTLTRRGLDGIAKEAVTGLDAVLDTIAREFGLEPDLTAPERERLSHFTQ